jgi:hypothetical protein
MLIRSNRYSRFNANTAVARTVEKKGTRIFSGTPFRGRERRR